MTYIPVLYSLMVTVFVAYVSYIWANYGVQKSISQSYYVLPDNLKFLMTLFCWGFAFPAMIIGNSFWMMLAGGGIIFVGAAAAFKQKMTKIYHFAGAGIGITASQIATIRNFELWPFTIGFVVIGLILLLLRKKIKGWIWWLEITAFISICIVLGITLF